jgi:radical SAM superfamily enzyme YgiQ (UPF0313 family)
MTTATPPFTGACNASLDSIPVHPSGSKARVLLSSVFGPYARDDEYGSRTMNPMELWHNQVTRVQGPFSLRMFHRSWGLMLIQANLDAPCTCLDFPSLERFTEEIRDNQYDVIGISAIHPNLLKVKKMCELIREHLPEATIVIGGHISGYPELADRIDADHIVRGEGVRWFRTFLGQDTDDPIHHPQIWSGINRRTMGVDLAFNPRSASATLIPSVGCPIGCNFCSTSAMFGGKGHFVNFYPEAEDLFAVMCQLEEEMKIRSFFVMDENFLLQRPRAIKLLELMQQNEKPWAIYVFSSANALRQYTMEELVGLGVSWVWLGLEGKNSQYGKLKNTDTHQLVSELQDHGIRVQGSSIIGLEEHTPENIDEAIDYAVSHDADCHQFMLYTPVAGTPLYAEHKADGTLMGEDEIDTADVHGQYRFNFHHPNIPVGQETDMLLRAFNEDYRINGPSVLRMIHTALKGWKRYRNHPERRIRERVAWEVEGMSTVFAGSFWAGRKWFKDNPPLAKRIDDTLREIRREFGIVAKITAPIVGRYLYNRIAREAKRLDAGWTYEPPTFYERNYDHTGPGPVATRIRSVPGLAAPATVVTP